MMPAARYKGGHANAQIPARDAGRAAEQPDHPVGARERVKIGRQWWTGTAAILDDDDPDVRSRTLPHKLDAALGGLMASHPLTIRIDLETLT
jgi:hypothetical protein